MVSLKLGSFSCAHDPTNHSVVYDFAERSIISLIGVLTELTLINSVGWSRNDPTNYELNLGKHKFEISILNNEPPLFVFDGSTLQNHYHAGDYGLDRLLKAVLDQIKKVEQLEFSQLASSR